MSAGASRAASTPIVLDEGPCASDGVTLYRRYVRPESGAIAQLAIVHGYGDHGGRYVHFMRWLAERAIACHALDLRGQGKAGGRRGFVARWDHYLDDVRTLLALPELRQSGAPPTFLLGHSHGGLVAAAAVIAQVEGLDAVRGCILTSPFFRNRLAVPGLKVLLARAANPLVPWLKFRTGLREEWMSSDADMIGESRSDPHRVRVATPRWYLGMLRAQEQVLSRAGEFRLPLLVLAGSADPVADPDTAKEFVQRAASADKTFQLYPELLHELLREKDREQVFQAIRRWITARTERQS